MTSVMTPSTGETRPSSHINFNVKKYRPGERVLYKSKAVSSYAIDTIDCYTDGSGNFFTIDGERTFVRDILGRVPADVDAGAVLLELGVIPPTGAGTAAYAAHKAAEAAVLRKYGIE